MVAAWRAAPHGARDREGRREGGRGSVEGGSVPGARACGAAALARAARGGQGVHRMESLWAGCRREKKTLEWRFF